jgi:pyruvate/2-oxoglutarate dehydrogenase complex dihydrolipoamide acyltransferase (E2) component
MPTPVHVPRVNNNDDTVLIVSVGVKEGEFVKRTQIVGSVETDKAVVDVEAERDGFVLRILGQPDERVSVGSVFLWLGDTAEELVPDQPPPALAPANAAGKGRPTAKASAMLKELGIDPEQVPVAGERMTVTDVEAWLGRQKHPQPKASSQPGAIEEATPAVAGEYQDLSPEAHGMLTTVLWHRDHSAHGYLEIEYEPKPWEEYAAEYARQNKLMLSPLMALMAFRLVQLARANPNINATIVNGRRYQYGPVNLGFTVQAGQTLYLTVVAGAQDMQADRFLQVMGEVQRHAMTRKLRPAELSGATLAFSSMARWNVSRHIPILPPQTGIIVAHAASRSSGTAVLGASYDHRLLSGFDVVQVLQALAQPPERD